MRFNAFFILSVAATALSAPAVMRREQVNGNVLFCTEKDFKGICGRTPPVDNNCRPLDGPFKKNVSSFQIEPSASFVCLLWSGDNCQGTNIGGWIKNPVSDLGVYNFDNIASSFQCKNL
ncbi:unnamed protein product [Rhizoctonia solani]|uniref:Uncharacterized protein n=1 Tax=Rhizoctonia solani TaxID=456999 RepID=A0A8H2WVL7_9AGAM|nr:unnamed protein product [Rhizoctonia solani]